MILMVIVGMPCLVLILSVAWRLAGGPFWVGINSDPAYQYLMNALYLADHRVPLYFQHPGTPVQLLGAVVIKLLNPQASNALMVENVLKNPEFYLHVIYAVLILFYTVSLIALAYYAYRKSGDILFAFLVQTPAFLYLTMGKILGFVSVSANVCPESLLAGLINIYGICLLRAFFTQDTKPFWATALCWGGVYGLMVASKFTTLSLLLIPVVMIPSFRDKMFFCMMALAAFVLATQPVWSRYPSMWGNLYGMLSHTEFRGNGPQGFIAWNTFLNGITLIFTQFWFLMTGVGAALGVLFYKIVRGPGDRLNKAHTWAIWTGLTIVLQFLIVAKETAFQYMVPALALFGFFWALMYLGSREKIRFWRMGAVVFVVLSLVLNFIYIRTNYKITSAMQAFSREIYFKKNAVVCAFYRSTSVPFALVFADNSYGLNIYGNIIEKLYPRFYSMDIGQFKMDQPRGAYLEDALNQGREVFLYGSKLPENSFSPLFRVKRIAQREQEAVYELLEANDKKAFQLFYLAEMALSQGQAQIAYALGSKAKTLGLPAACDLIAHMDEMIAKNRAK